MNRLLSILAVGLVLVGIFLLMIALGQDVWIDINPAFALYNHEEGKSGFCLGAGDGAKYVKIEGVSQYALINDANVVACTRNGFVWVTDDGQATEYKDRNALCQRLGSEAKFAQLRWKSVSRWNDRGIRYVALLSIATFAIAGLARAVAVRRSAVSRCSESSGDHALQ